MSGPVLACTAVTPLAAQSKRAHLWVWRARWENAVVELDLQLTAQPGQEPQQEWQVSLVQAGTQHVFPTWPQEALEAALSSVTTLSVLELALAVADWHEALRPYLHSAARLASAWAQGRPDPEWEEALAEDWLDAIPMLALPA